MSPSTELTSAPALSQGQQLQGTLKSTCHAGGHRTGMGPALPQPACSYSPVLPRRRPGCTLSSGTSSSAGLAAAGTSSAEMGWMMWPLRVMTRGAVSFWKARCVFHVAPTGVRMLCSNCWCFSKGKGSSLTCGEWHSGVTPRQHPGGCSHPTLLLVPAHPEPAHTIPCPTDPWFHPLCQQIPRAGTAKSSHGNSSSLHHPAGLWAVKAGVQAGTGDVLGMGHRKAPECPRGLHITHLMCCCVDVALFIYDDVGQVLVLPGRRRRRLEQEPAGHMHAQPRGQAGAHAWSALGPGQGTLQQLFTLTAFSSWCWASGLSPPTHPSPAAPGSPAVASHPAPPCASPGGSQQPRHPRQMPL